MLTRLLFVLAHVSGLLIGIYSTFMIATQIIHTKLVELRFKMYLSYIKDSDLIQLLVVNFLSLLISFSSLENDFSPAKTPGNSWLSVHISYSLGKAYSCDTRYLIIS